MTLVCCFCGDQVNTGAAVRITLEPPGSRNGTQRIYSHPKCLTERLRAEVPTHPDLGNSWFGAKVLFKTEIDGKSGSLLEQSFRVVFAADEAEARVKAEAHGREHEHQYKNEAGEMVSWRFVEVLEVQDLLESDVTDGMEVFSILLRDSSQEST